MSTALERVRAVVEPLADEAGVELFDLELAGGVLRVTIDKPPAGVDLADITAVTRAVSRALDEIDPITGRYTLEVSSPGLERTLRTPAHFAWAVDRDVAIKLVPAHEGDRRLSGRLVACSDHGITVALDGDATGESVELAYDAIETARTVLHWGPSPKPGAGSKPGKGAKAAKAAKGAKAAEAAEAADVTTGAEGAATTNGPEAAPARGATDDGSGRTPLDDGEPATSAGGDARTDRNEEKANAS